MRRWYLSGTGTVKGELSGAIPLGRGDFPVVASFAEVGPFAKVEIEQGSLSQVDVVEDYPASVSAHQPRRLEVGAQNDGAT